MIDESAKQPFFLYFPHYAAHIPLEARGLAVDEYRARNGGKDFPNPIYAAMVENFDASVGRITKALERAGVADNTVLLITSDNGGPRYEGSSRQPVTDNAPLRGGQGPPV